MKLKYIALASGLVLTSLSSCSDFLDKVPDTRVDLKTVDQCRELLVDAYASYNYGPVGELSSDNVIDNNSPSDNGVRYNLNSYSSADDELYAWEDVKSGIGSDTPSGVWEGCYHAIAATNAVLERVAELEKDSVNLSATDLEKLKAVKGEALVSRAYHHFILVNVFCMPYRGTEVNCVDPGVPYVTKPETTVLVHYDRGTVAEDYEKIEKDLTEGLPLINDGLYEIPRYHFNRAAANAFAARFYLFKREYDKVLTYANAAFNGSDPATMMNTIWGQAGNFYYIKDINRYFVSISRPGNFLLMSTYSTWSRRNSSNRYTTNRDAKRATIEGPGPTWEGCKWRNSSTNETFSMHPAFNGVCGVCSESEYGKYFAGTMGEQFEYTDKVQGIGYVHMVRAEFTAEETLLCRAEAKLFLGDTEGCVADLKIWDEAHKVGVASTSSMIPMTANAIVKFYGSKDPGFGIVKPIHIDEVCATPKYKLTAEMEPYMQCIQHLRRIETIHNGMRWFDIKRLGLSITHKIGRDEVKTLKTLDPRYAIQIPSEVLSAGLEANPRLELGKAGSSDAVVVKAIPETSDNKENHQ